MYDRNILPHLGVHVPGNMLHDYSRTGTLVVIAAIEIAIAARRGVGTLPIATQPLHDALVIERASLAPASLELPCPSCGGHGIQSIDREREWDCDDCGGSGSFDPVAEQIELALVRMGAA